MRIKNKTQRLIVLNFKKGGKQFTALHLGGGVELEEADLKDADIEWYVKRGDIEILDTKKTKAPVDPIVLPENPTAEILKDTFKVKELRQYCKENGIDVPTGSKEDDIVALIMDSLAPAGE